MAESLIQTTGIDILETISDSCIEKIWPWNSAPCCSFEIFILLDIQKFSWQWSQETMGILAQKFIIVAALNERLWMGGYWDRKDERVRVGRVGHPLNFSVSGKIQVMTVSWSTADFGWRSIAWQFSLWLHLVFWCSYLEQSLLKLFLEDIMSLPEM